MPTPNFLAIGSIIIDDIVYPDGRTSMGVLGGGGTHAAYGIAFAGEKPALVGLVGEDLPAISAPASKLISIAPRSRLGRIIRRCAAGRSSSGMACATRSSASTSSSPLCTVPPADSPACALRRARGFTLLRGARTCRRLARALP